MHSNHPSYSLLFDAFARLGQHLEDEVREEIMSSTYLESYPKGEIILPYKEVCRNVYFITQGFVMISFQEGEREYIDWFMQEGDVFISVASFFDQLPSEDRIVTLENTTCIVMPKNVLDDIAGRYLSFSEIRRKLTEHYYKKADEKKRLRPKRAYDRCVYMYEKHYPIFIRAADYLMAKYLCISQQTFSSEKNKMFRKRGLSDI